MIIKPTRRSFITGLTSLLVAPAIVRVENIMPVKSHALTVEEISSEAEKIFAYMLERQRKINIDHSWHTAMRYVFMDGDNLKMLPITNEEFYDNKA